MGYYYTAEPENAVPAKFWATPKTHVPGSPVKERGYRFYMPENGRWTTRDPIEEGGGKNLYSFVKNRSVSLIDYLGMAVSKCLVKSFGLKVRHWDIENPGWFSDTWRRLLYVDFKLVLDSCSKKEDCLIDQKKEGFSSWMETGAIMPWVPGSDTASPGTDDYDPSWSSHNIWDGSGTFHNGGWSTTGWFGFGNPKAEWYDSPGFSFDITQYNFPVYKGGVGGSGWMKYTTRVLDSDTLSVVRQLTWGIEIKYSAATTGFHKFTLNP